MLVFISPSREGTPIEKLFRSAELREAISSFVLSIRTTFGVLGSVLSAMLGIVQDGRQVIETGDRRDRAAYVYCP